MRYLLFLLFSLLVLKTTAQYQVQEITLPTELADPNNQLSSLSIHQGSLFFMSESRLQENMEARIFSVELTDLDKKILDTTYKLPSRVYRLTNLEILRNKMEAAGQNFEGLEAMSIDINNDVYLTIEAGPSSTNGYLVKGQLKDTEVVLDPDYLVALTKPTQANGLQVFNAGFEALGKDGGNAFAFFEYNYFPSGNFGYRITKTSAPNPEIKKVKFRKQLPFRITDVTRTGKNQFTAINYFYSGDINENAYRPSAHDTKSNKLVKTNSGYRSYCRLVKIKFTGKRFKWKPLFEFPEKYWPYNWEGIAAYKEGYFIMNDKYTPKPPFRSTLLYFKKQ
jgi:hypothetical protein